MSFWPLRPVFWRAAVVGLACAAFVWASRAGEGVRNIEVVPFASITTDTNSEPSSPDTLRTFKAWEPRAPHPYSAPAPSSGPLPLARPQRQQILTLEQQQLLDRRRNWVFMTPDDYATADGNDGKDPIKSQSADDKNMTAMERFYQRMSDSEKAAVTNRLGKANSALMSNLGNSSGGARQNSDASPFTASPFAGNPDSGVFQSIPRNVFGNSLGDDNTVKTLTPEEVRAQTAQKARMDTYKQLFDFNQTPATTPVVSTPAPGPIDSAPLFGAAAPAVSSSTLNTVKPVTPGTPVTRQFTSQPEIAAPRVSTPPHADFAAPQRPF